jgi:hypothetical protein
MVISGRASAKAVVEINETDAQPVASATTAGPLSTPDLLGTNYYRLWPTRWRGGQGLRQHTNTQHRDNHAYPNTETDYAGDIKEGGFSNVLSVHNLFPFSLGFR